MTYRRLRRSTRARDSCRARGLPNLIEALEGRRLLATVFFDGGGGTGHWNNPDNWSGHQIPTAEDDVSIGYGFDVALTGAPAAVRTLSVEGSATLTVETALAIGMNSYAQPGTSFNLRSGGTLDGTGDLYLLGELDWTGGVMQGAGRTVVAFGGSARVSGDEGKDLRRTMLVEDFLEIDDTTIRFRDGTLQLDPRAWFGLIDTDILNDGGANRIDNAGSFNASGFLSRIEVPVHHGGTAEIYGRLHILGGGSATGTFELFPTDSQLRVGGPGYTFGEGSRIFGEGASLGFLGGTSTVAEPLDVDSLYLSGAQVTLGESTNVSGPTHVEGSSVLNLAGAVSNLAEIEVETASRINLVGDGTHVLRTAYPGIHETARLDVGREAVIFDYSTYSALLDVRSMICGGYAGGAWTGAGICSQAAGAAQAALGYAESSSLFSTFPATFMGQPVDDSAIVVRFTRYGDANLDGTVDLADFNRLAGGFGATDAYWTQGDFDYGGSVTLHDFNLLGSNFGQSGLPAEGEADEIAPLLA